MYMDSISQTVYIDPIVAPVKSGCSIDTRTYFYMYALLFHPLITESSSPATAFDVTVSVQKLLPLASNVKCFEKLATVTPHAGVL